MVKDLYVCTVYMRELLRVLQYYFNITLIWVFITQQYKMNFNNNVERNIGL